MNYEINKDLENQACDYELINEIATDNWLSPAHVSLTKLDEIKRSSNFVRPRSAHRPNPRSRYHKSFVELRAEPPLSKFHDNLAWVSNTSIQPLTTCPGECRAASPWSVIEASTTTLNKFRESQMGTLKILADETERTLTEKDTVSTEVIPAPAPCPSPDLDVIVKQLQVSEEEEELQTLIPTQFCHQLHDSKAGVKLLRRPIALRPSANGSIDDYQKDHYTFTRPQSCHCHHYPSSKNIETMMSEIRLLDEVDSSNLEGQKETPPVEKEPSQQIPSSAKRVTTELTNRATKLKRCKSAMSRCSVNSKGGSPSSLVRSSKPSVKSAQTKNQKCIERRRNREAVKALRDGSLLQHKKYTKLLFYEENFKLERRKPEDEQREINEIITAEEAKFGTEVIEMQQYLLTQGIHIPLHKLQRGLCAPSVNNYHKCIEQNKNALTFL